MHPEARNLLQQRLRLSGEVDHAEGRLPRSCVLRERDDDVSGVLEERPPGSSRPFLLAPEPRQQPVELRPFPGVVVLSHRLDFGIDPVREVLRHLRVLVQDHRPERLVLALPVERFREPRLEEPGRQSFPEREEDFRGLLSFVDRRVQRSPDLCPLVHRDDLVVPHGIERFLREGPFEQAGDLAFEVVGFVDDGQRSLADERLVPLRGMEEVRRGDRDNRRLLGRDPAYVVGAGPLEVAVVLPDGDAGGFRHRARGLRVEESAIEPVGAGVADFPDEAPVLAHACERGESFGLVGREETDAGCADDGRGEEAGEGEGDNGLSGPWARGEDDVGHAFLEERMGPFDGFGLIGAWGPEAEG